MATEGKDSLTSPFMAGKSSCPTRQSGTARQPRHVGGVRAPRPCHKSYLRAFTFLFPLLAAAWASSFARFSLAFCFSTQAE